MTTKRFAVLMCLLVGSLSSYSQKLPYKNPALSVDERVKDLLGRMTPEEKFWQLFMVPGEIDYTNPDQYKNGIFGFQVSASSKETLEAQQMLNYNTAEDALVLTRKINSIQKFLVEKTRLGIPMIAFDEALHGLVRAGATSFPQAIGLAATFDTTLMREVSTAIAVESKARGIRQILSPVINIASDVRWGRVEETYGEDPVLTSAMAVAFVKPFEKSGVITTPKHLIANVGDGGRDSYPIHFTERFLEEIHFPPFKAVFELGGTRSVMTSYNSYDGVPMSNNEWILTEKLKRDWKFNGFVISDANAVGGSVVLHNTAKNSSEAGMQSINAGLDVIFQSDFNHYKIFMKGFLADGRNQARIDGAVSRVLKAKFELGLFENPYASEDLVKKIAKDKSHKALALKAALESIVLLKNDNATLPLSGIKSIAVIGEDATEARLGGYSGPGNKKVSILDGVMKRAGTTIKVGYAEGCKRIATEWVVVAPEYLSSSGKPGLQAEYFKNIDLSGKPDVVKTVPNIDFLWTLSSPDRTMESDFYSARWTGELKSPTTGTFKIGLAGNDGFRMFIDDHLVIDNWKKETFRTILKEFKFEKDKTYKVRIEFFEPIGFAKVQLIWNAPLNDDSEKKIQEAVELAKQSDISVVVAGIHEGEFQDRAFLSLPGKQEELINRIAATGKKVVVVLVGGSAITMSKWLGNVSSVVDVWYPGEEGGNAVAQVWFGDHNPGGKLPITFPISESQLPLVYNHKPTGRADYYYDLSGQPLFPFGFGLSYTTFLYSNSKLSRSEIQSTESATLSFTLTNTGKVAGDEVVQLYVTDVSASVARPVIELKDFKRIHLQPGQSKEISFVISPSMLSMLNAQMQTVVEPGEFLLRIGSSSRDIRLKQTLTVK